jgi:hypothetical protein
MALQLKKALSAYDRLDVADVDCGNGWICQVKSFASVVKVFAKEQARVKAIGGFKKKAQTASAVLLQPDGTPTITDDNPYLLGTFEADVEFMVDNILVGWTTLIDDDGTEVPYSKDNALELFLENGAVAEQLYRELIGVSLNSTNYVKPLTAQAEEDGKN